MKVIHLKNYFSSNFIPVASIKQQSSLKRLHGNFDCLIPHPSIFGYYLFIHCLRTEPFSTHFNLKPPKPLQPRRPCNIMSRGVTTFDRHVLDYRLFDSKRAIKYGNNPRSTFIPENKIKPPWVHLQFIRPNATTNDESMITCVTNTSNKRVALDEQKMTTKA
jgi:hypothetical protein